MLRLRAFVFMLVVAIIIGMAAWFAVLLAEQFVDPVVELWFPD
jgi:hypothetical protein